MNRSAVAGLLSIALAVFISPMVHAGGPATSPKAGCETCGSTTPSTGCDTCGTPCGPQYVSKTIMVPQWSTVPKTITETCYRQVRRSRKVMVNRCVSRTKMVKEVCNELRPRTVWDTVDCTVHVPKVTYVDQPYSYRVPEWKWVNQPTTVCRPVWHTDTIQVPVCYPVRHKHQGTRQVSQMVPHTQMVSVCRDEGHWATRTVAAKPACGSCGKCSSCCTPCTTTCRVWVPKMVTHKVPCTTYRCQTTSVPYTYYTTSYQTKMEPRQVRRCTYQTQVVNRKVRVCSYRVVNSVRKVAVHSYDTKVVQRKVARVVCETKQVVRQRPVTTYHTVSVPSTETYYECEPYTVKRTIHVSVCNMVAKTIQVPVSCATTVDSCVESCGTTVRRFGGLFGGLFRRCSSCF